MTPQAMTSEDDRIWAEEDLVIDAQFLLQGLMNDKGISRAELARMTGLSRARLTQIMRPEANPTLKTLASIFYALGERIDIDLASKRTRPLRSDQGGWSIFQEDTQTENLEFGSHYAQWLDRPLAAVKVDVASNDNPAAEQVEMQVA